MDEEFEFWYPVIIEKQMTFEGKEVAKEVLLRGHIIHGGRLLCEKSMEVLKNQVKAKNAKISKKRIERTRLCEECQRKYRLNGHSAWNAWAEGKPKQPSTTPLPPLAKF